MDILSVGCGIWPTKRQRSLGIWQLSPRLPRPCRMVTEPDDGQKREKRNEHQEQKLWRNPVLEQATQQPAEYPPAGARQRVDRCGLAKADRLTQLRELREVDDLQQTQTTPPRPSPRSKPSAGHACCPSGLPRPPESACQCSATEPLPRAPARHIADGISWKYRHAAAPPGWRRSRNRCHVRPTAWRPAF